ncbi:single-stranded DNA-binding protein [Klebsiella variicola]|uniref:single-stranded DNA-binding protein n=1 Tax=Klebsiella variicola TaxID=244366 RepID=UPI000C9A512C|nr:single-stranded DNA-binding protein [Klebsiella variicola]SXF86157.1 single-stranded DNA-binding protein [Klebsiella variicola]
MTAQLSAYGRLVADPETRATGKGTSMAMARLAVSLPCNAAADGQATFWLGVIAFGKQADALAKHQKGDLVSVAGAMQVNQWTGKDGGTQQGYQVVADSVISARTARPGGKRGASDSTNEVNKGHTTQPAPGWEIYNTPDDFDQRPPFDDEDPF